ncbi:MAG: sulfite exporter TauE/SafE family protein, partial [Beijerinckiaceae bacterium]
LGATLVIGGLIGTLIGVLFFNAMRRAGYFELVLVLSYVTLLGSVGGLMMVESLRSIIFSKRQKTQKPLRTSGRWWFERLPFRVKFERSQLAISVIPIIALGLFIGFAGAVLGIGGGFMVVPALIYFFRMPTAMVVGTSLFQILFTMIAATILHAITNQSVDIVLALILIVGSVLGAQFGARVGQNLKGEYFRLLLALLVFGVAVRFAIEIGIQPTERFSVENSEQRQ